MESLPPDHFATSYAYTPHIYRDQYPSIDPSSPLLSLSSKIIIITGASSGIGAQGFAPAFAKARPIAIVLVGRKATKLQATKTAIQPLAPETRILTIAADLTDVASVEKLFAEVKAEVGHADVLVNNAGVFSPSGTLVSVSPTDWWNDFEVNVKGTFLVTQGFLKLLGTERQGSVITMSTGIAYMTTPTLSAYSMSKMASARLSEYIALEHPNICAVALQPGVVKTDMVTDTFKRFALDTPELVGGTGVWLASDAARFLTGRFVSANWSVDDLMDMKSKILGGEDLKFVYQGRLGLDQFA